MQAVQRQIAADLKVQPPFKDTAALEAEIARRITFIQCCLHNARLKTLVLGISGGVDSLTAGLMAQRAVEQLREQTGDQAYLLSLCACLMACSTTKSMPRRRSTLSSRMSAKP